MNDWSHGYVADEPYTVSYQSGLAPAHLDLVCRIMGVVWEPPADAVICELGCGRGYSSLVLAAADPRRTVIGIDYNPAHIAEARSIAAEAKLDNVRFLDTDLAEVTDAEIDRLPEFDLVVTHGVWSWVGDPVRQGILRLLERRVKPGGVVHVSYNALPGFAQDLALQRLVRTAAPLFRGGSTSRAREAIGVARSLFEAGATHLHQTSLGKKMIATGDDELDPSYVAHEMLPEHWRPVFHADIAADMARARLEFVGSATLFENVPELCMTEAQRKVHATFPPGPGQELVKDLCLTRPFRRDVFMRGAQRVDRTMLLDSVLLGLQVEDAEAPKLGVEVGAAEMPPEMAEPIMAALREGPQTLGRLRNLPPNRKPNAAELAVLLCGTPTCLPMVEVPPGAQAAAARFNMAAARRYRGALGPRLGVAAPGSGAAIPCHANELALAADAAAFPDDTPQQRAQRLAANRSEEGIAEVAAMIERVFADRMPVWRRFAVVQP